MFPGDAQCVFADAGMFVAERVQNRSRCFCKAQRVQARERVRAFRRYFFEQRHRAFVSAPGEQRVRFVALPFVRRIECGDEFHGAQLVEAHDFSRSVAVVG